MSGAGGFPEAPKGEPGGIRQAARSLGRTAKDLRDAGRGLSTVNSALAGDWDGDAATAYRGVSQILGKDAGTTAGLLDDAESTVTGYAAALERAQDELKRLKTAYDDAKAREAAAAARADRLAGDMLSAPTGEVSGLETDIASASGDARSAGGEAGRILERAQRVLEEFRREEKKADGKLTDLAGARDGATRGLGATIMGSGAAVSSEISSDSIPGFERYWRSDWHNQNLEEDNSLLNPIGWISGGLAAGLGRRAVLAAAERIASGFGSTVEGGAVRNTLRDAAERAIARGATGEADAQGATTAINGMSHREIEGYLVDALGVRPEYARQAARSFVPGTAHVRIADESTYALRFHGGESPPVSYYTAPTVDQGAARARSALPPGNTLEHIAQFRVRPGTPYVTGRIAPNAGFGQPGGGMQYYIPDLKNLEPVK